MSLQQGTSQQAMETMGTMEVKMDHSIIVPSSSDQTVLEEILSQNGISSTISEESNGFYTPSKITRASSRASSEESRGAKRRLLSISDTTDATLDSCEMRNLLENLAEKFKTGMFVKKDFVDRSKHLIYDNHGLSEKNKELQKSMRQFRSQVEDRIVLTEHQRDVAIQEKDLCLNQMEGLRNELLAKENELSTLRGNLAFANSRIDNLERQVALLREMPIPSKSQNSENLQFIKRCYDDANANVETPSHVMEYVPISEDEEEEVFA